MVKRKLLSRYKLHLFIPLLFLLLVAFVSTFLLGRQYGSSDIDEVTQFIKDNELNTESFLVEQELIENLGKESCDLAQLRIESLSEQLWQMGIRLSGPTAKQDLGSATYTFLKRKFHLLQIRTYTLYKKLKQDCNLPTHILLFYFSLNDENSAEQGRILDTLVNKYDMQVYAIEYNYSSELQFLERYFNVTQTPTLIIDYDKKIEGLASAETIEADLLKNEKT